MAYDEWTDRIEYRIDNYPGAGYVCTIPIRWLPGMAGDFRDIRFSDRLGAKLPYWVQASTQFSTATVNVRLGNSPYIFLHYGNGVAVSESNGDATFEFFDHFDGAVLNSNKWDKYPIGMDGNYSVGNGELAIWTRTNNFGEAPFYGVIRSKVMFGVGYELVTRARQDATGDYTLIGFYDAWHAPAIGYSAAAVSMNYDNTIRAFLRNNPSQSDSSAIQSFSTSAYYKLQVKRLADGSCTVVVDGSNSVTLETNKWSGAGYVNIENWTGHPVGAIRVDWIYVKKLAVTEPTAVLVGGGYLVPQNTKAFIWQQTRHVQTVQKGGPGSYPEWSECVSYRINDYPGDGYVCTFSITWKPGMKSDFSDIRFSDGVETKLSYWIESYTAFTSASVQVRLGRSPKVYLHYGNGAAASESNGVAVFDFFDDCKSGVASTKWKTVVANNGTVNYATYDGRTALRLNASWEGQLVVCAKNVTVSSGVFEARVNAGLGCMMTVLNNQLVSSMYTYRPNYNGTAHMHRCVNGTYTLLKDGASTYSLTNWSTWKMTFNGGNLNAYYNNVLHLTAADSTLTSGSVGARAPSSTAIYLTDIRLRKYVAVEPTPAQIGTSSRPVRYFGEWREHSRESGLYVKPSQLLATPARVLNRASSMFVKPSSENVDWILGSARDVRMLVPNIRELVDRDLATIRQAGMYIPSIMDNTRVIQRVCYRYADFLVHSVKTVTLAEIAYAWPTYPFVVNYEIDGEAVTVQHEIALGDSVRMVGWLHDTDPFSAVRRDMSFVGYRVKLVMYGGSPATLVVKDCSVSSGGRVECGLKSSDITVPGDYICKFVVLGVHESVIGYRKEVPENRRDWFRLRVNGGD